jgi:hypothetical protein
VYLLSIIAFVCSFRRNLRPFLGLLVERLHGMTLAATLAMLGGEADLTEIVGACGTKHFSRLI